MNRVSSHALPTIPSELLEPHLSRLFAVMIQELACHSEPPPASFFLEWHTRFEGVSYFMNDMNCVHATLAWGHMTHDVLMAREALDCPFKIRPKEALAKRKLLWECSVEAIRGVDEGQDRKHYSDDQDRKHYS